MINATNYQTSKNSSLNGGGLLDLDFQVNNQLQQNISNQDQYLNFGVPNQSQSDPFCVQSNPRNKIKKQLDYAQNSIQTPQKLSGSVQRNLIGSLNECQNESLLSSPFDMGNSEIKPK